VNSNKIGLLVSDKYYFTVFITFSHFQITLYDTEIGLANLNEVLFSTSYE
jgi:hypothetical protein